MRRPANQRYPWAEWIANEVNEHRAENPRSFRNYLYEYAKRKEIWVHAVIDGDIVRFSIYPTFAEYEERRPRAAKPEHGFRGRFISAEEAQAMNRACVVCGEKLTPATPDGENECWKFDFDTGAFAKVHSPAE